MTEIVLVFLTALLIVVFAIPSIITVAKLKGLYDKPNERKIHANKIPRLGGLAVFIGYLLSLSVLGNLADVAGLQYLFAAFLLLFFSGLKDDIIVLSPMKKLGAQLVATGLVSVMTPVRLTNLHGVFGIAEIPLGIAIPLTMFTIIVITNSFNLIDGADGLAGALGLVMTISFGILFALQQEFAWSVMAFGLSGALLGFLFFNFNPAKIFMGDAGSLTTGFLLSLFAIHFIEINAPGMSPVNKFSSAPGIAIAILLVPLYDTLRVFILRTSKKKSPFEADRNHIHHWLMRIGMNHKEVSLTLTLINMAFIGVAYTLKDNPAYVVVSVIIGLALIVGQLPVYFYRHRLSDLEADDSALIELQENLRGNPENINQD
ncbi:MAG: undecaprenyl/decaprenyl-phosphate alpha-N-acetylglucosaminyl 1-phosphate transferase [Bacteroidetes bacterium]|nr:undecaprenyl/decaprenyl-phosphate alpha-N-acetylglucosaminyl 1-phosphate transferase [Bacteroidota bacterium]MCK6610530.1 undecaprenyl/decaprenyl-phosphate alpha-N-acetylglucosaminyl 1-phosphate transferase [Bacteroidia bacterium]